MNDTFDQTPGAPYEEEKRGNPMAVASLVLGLVSVVLMCWVYVALPCGILAIVFGSIGRKNARRGAKGGPMATAGFILGIFGVGLPILLFVGCLAFLGIGGEAIREGGEAFMEGVQKAAEQIEAQQGTAP